MDNNKIRWSNLGCHIFFFFKNTDKQEKIESEIIIKEEEIKNGTKFRLK